MGAAGGYIFVVSASDSWYYDVMDDTAQNANQDDTQIQPQAAPPQPVGSIAKEHGPVGTTEFIKPSGAEVAPSIPPEAVEHGVEVVPSTEAPPLTVEHKEAGIHPAKESVPVSVQPQQTIQLPMTEEEALKIIKTTGVSDSRHWLAVLIEKVYKQLRFLHRKLVD